MAGKRGGSRRRAARRRIGARERGRSGFTAPGGWAGRNDLGGDLLRRRAAPTGSLRAWPSVISRFDRVSRLQGRVTGLVAVGPLRRLAGARRGQLPRSLERLDPEPDPADQLDASTPTPAYANAVHAEQLLGNAVLLTQEGYGHRHFQNPSACVDKAMVDYLTELITPPTGTVCQSNQQPFDPGFG